MKQNGLDRGRLKREWKTVRAMLGIYCRHHHEAAEGLCAACRELEAYAKERLGCCPYGKLKPTCAHCDIHCYKPEQKEAIRQVMRFAGPRMMFRHPILALAHLLDKFRRKPCRK